MQLCGQIPRQHGFGGWELTALEGVKQPGAGRLQLWEVLETRELNQEKQPGMYFCLSLETSLKEISKIEAGEGKGEWWFSH